jgi:hypothetical protein
MLATEFDEISITKIRISIGGTYHTTSEFIENVDIPTVNNIFPAYNIQDGLIAEVTSGVGTSFPGVLLTANVYAPYDILNSEFAMPQYGAGNGTYMRHDYGQNVIVYNDIDEVTDLFGRGIVRDGLVLDLDAGIPASYSGSGTTWNDLSGNSNTGTLTNGPTYSSANNGSIIFDGSDDYVALTGSTTVSQATFSVWLRRNGSQNSSAGILFSRSASASGFNFFPGTNNLGYHWNNAVSTYSYNSGLTVPDNAWSMCVLSITSTTATFYLCQSSGITTATSTQAHASAIIDALTLGYDGFSTRYFKGDIAQASIYNRALSAAEISQNFNALRNRFGL